MERVVPDSGHGSEGAIFFCLAFLLLFGFWLFVDAMKSLAGMRFLISYRDASGHGNQTGTIVSCHPQTASRKLKPALNRLHRSR